jgi:monoamine oxidase
VPVQEISNTPEGVEVRVRGRRNPVHGDYCVCTIPPQVLKDVPTNFSDPVKRALAYPVGEPVSKIGLEYRRRFWEEDDRIVGGYTATNMDLSSIWYPSYGYLGRRGTLLGYYTFGAEAEMWGRLTPDQRRAHAVAQGKKIHGDPYETELDHAFSVSWHRTRYSQGGWVSWPSRNSGEYERLLEPDGRTYFAGDHLSYYIAWQAGAIDSARKVVTEVHDRVRATA